jgi:glycosyltransferase involved in cell wall biosynthesis/GT2 family glycosyltransferase
MRLMLVHQAYPPEGLGGSEIYTESLARRLAGDHEVTVLHRTADPARSDYEIIESRREGVRVVALNTPRWSHGGFEAYRDPRAAAAAAAIIEATRPDLVHAGNLHGLSTGVVFEARRLGAPVVLTLHDFGTLCALGQLVNLDLDVCPGPTPRRCLGCVGGQVALPVSRFKAAARKVPLAQPAARLLSRLTPLGEGRVHGRLLEMREVLRQADVLISPSRFLRDRMAALGVSGIRVLPFGHDPVAPPARKPDAEDGLRVGFVGTLVPSKGAHVLARAFRDLADRRLRLRIHGGFAPYHGDTGYEARLRDVLGPLADDALRGPFAHSRLNEVLAEIDVLVVPSIWEENAPLVVQEAFLAGVPVVVSGHGGLAEAVRDGIDGLHFRPGDAADLGRALRRLADDPVLRRRLAAQAPRVPTMDEHIGGLTALYAEARARYRARPGRVGVVVLDRGRAADAEAAARSALDPGLDPQVVVVENGPAAAPAVSPEIGILRLAENRGYAGGMNAGIAWLRGKGCDRFLLLNNDAILEAGSLRRLAEALEDTRLAAVGPVVLRAADGRIESIGARLDPRSGRSRLIGHGRPAHVGEGLVPVQSLSGAALMISGLALDRVGPLDEAYFHSFEDTDWCGRARAGGFGLAVVQGAVVRHGGGRTLGMRSPDRLYYAARNHLRAAERLSPSRGAARWLRRAAIVWLNLSHALRQGAVPRFDAVRAVLIGSLDFGRGRFGPRGGSG